MKLLFYRFEVDLEFLDLDGKVGEFLFIIRTNRSLGLEEFINESGAHHQWVTILSIKISPGLFRCLKDGEIIFFRSLAVELPEDKVRIFSGHYARMPFLAERRIFTDIDSGETR